METEQDKLIGKHPVEPSFFATWLDGEDIASPPDKPNKKHRKLTEIIEYREQAIQEIANFIIEHHVDGKKIDRIRRRKNEILKKYNLATIDEYMEEQAFFPTHEDTNS